MANKALESAANHGINDSNFEDTPGYCERFARQVEQSVLGSKFDGFYAATAADTARNFRDGNQDGYQSFPGEPPGGYQVGDVIYKEEDSDPPSGHVGIVVMHNGILSVAENSVTDIGRVRGGCGYRTLAQWPIEDCRVTVRFPDTVKAPRLMLGVRVTDDKGEHWGYKPSDTAAFDATASRWTINNYEIAHLLAKPMPIGLPVRLALRDALAALGMTVSSYDPSEMTDANDPRACAFVVPA